MSVEQFRNIYATDEYGYDADRRGEVANQPPADAIVAGRKAFYDALRALEGGSALAEALVWRLDRLNKLIGSLGYRDPLILRARETLAAEGLEVIRRYMRRGSGIQETTYGHEGYSRTRQF